MDCEVSRNPYEYWESSSQDLRVVCTVFHTCRTRISLHFIKSFLLPEMALELLSQRADAEDVNMDSVVLIGRLGALTDEMTDCLLDDGIDVFATDDSQSGILAGLSRHPSLAFVEVDSPANDNFEAVSQVRKECGSHCRIVAVCNRYSPYVEKVCSALGADFTIPQTEDRWSLMLLIRGLLWLDRPAPRDRNPDDDSTDNNSGRPARLLPFSPIRRQVAAL